MLKDSKYPFELPALPYAYDALEPFIDKETLQFHHDKHFNTYVTNLNAVLEKCPAFQSMTLEEIMKNLSTAPEDVRVALRNNAGGTYNHDVYFNLMSAKHNQEIPEAVVKAFGSADEFKKQMKATALACFGSGYAWLVKAPSGELKIMAAPNQDNPFEQGLTPILALDVWEHSYYLKYQNLRGDYIDNWLSVVDWEAVAKNL